MLMIGGMDLISAKDRNEITQAAKNYKADDFDLFAAEYGWSEWMLDFIPDDAGDDYELTESDVERINKTLQEVFDAAHKGAE